MRKIVRRCLWISLLSVAALGCSTHKMVWQHPDKQPAAYEADDRACKEYARATCATNPSFMDCSTTGMASYNQWSACMEKKGWRSAVVDSRKLSAN